jgi:hypothetical protein
MGLLEKQIYPDIKRQTQQTLGAPIPHPHFLPPVTTSTHMLWVAEQDRSLAPSGVKLSLICHPLEFSLGQKSKFPFGGAQLPGLCYVQPKALLKGSYMAGVCETPELSGMSP